MAKYPSQWQGLDSSDFRPYRRFINRQLPGICGSYAASVLVHYYARQVYQLDLNLQDLLAVLEASIDGRFPYPGSFPWDIVHGLNQFLDIGGPARWTLFSESAVFKSLAADRPLPVIVGTSRLFCSPYGNHWVLVYGYGYGEAGKLYYRCYDNHGRYQAKIPASQTTVGIYLDG